MAGTLADAKLLTFDDVRKLVMKESPLQFCVYLQILESEMDEHGFTDLKTFLTTNYGAGGLGLTMEKVELMLDYNTGYHHQANLFKIKLGLVEDAKKNPLPKHGAPIGNKLASKNEGDNVTSVSKPDKPKSLRGNSEAYTLKRLSRDRPDILARIEAGEISANQGAIEAGFRDKPVVLSKYLDKAIEQLENRFNIKVEVKK